jgi:hypothetical protein
MLISEIPAEITEGARIMPNWLCDFAIAIIKRHSGYFWGLHHIPYPI